MPRYQRPSKSKEQHLAEYKSICERNIPLIEAIDLERETPKKLLQELYKKRTALAQQITIKERYCKSLGYL